MLSKRLKIIADMVDTTRIIDVGCDHALLDIYLAKEKNIKCLAIDVREGIIKKVINSVKQEKLENNIEVKLNNGLDNILITNDDTVILSGLGTNTILNIIGEKKIPNLIIQSNDDLYLLRKNLVKKNYYILEEKIVLDSKYYIIIKFKLGKESYKYNELQFGPKLLKEKNEVFKNYLCMKQAYYEKILNDIPYKYLVRRIRTKNHLKQIKKALEI